MASWKVLLIAALCVSSALGICQAQSDVDVADQDDDYVDGDGPRAHLIVRKYINTEYAVSGKNLTIYIDTHNAGVR